MLDDEEFFCEICGNYSTTIASLFEQICEECSKSTAKEQPEETNVIVD
jgi:hypothetical protein